MSLEQGQDKQIFELRALKEDSTAVGIVILKNLIMVGRSVNCDLTINKTEVSNIHAVVEVQANGAGSVHDMNSTNGTFVNGEKLKGPCDIKMGDIISFAGVEFEFKNYESDSDSKHQLDILAPEKSQILFPERQKVPKKTPPTTEEQGPDFPYLSSTEDGSETFSEAPDLSSLLPDLPGKEKTPVGDEDATQIMPQTAKEQAKNKDLGPQEKIETLLKREEEKLKPQKPKEPPKPKYVSYPLGKDPKADQNEYIFEDLNEIYPIFDYDPKSVCLEVIILFHDALISVDYIPEKRGRYYLVGANPRHPHIEYPPLGKKSRAPLIDVTMTGDTIIHTLEGYDMLFLQDNEHRILDSEATQKEKEKIKLQGSGIIRFSKEALSLYIRRVNAPPKVQPPPFFGRDKELLKYLKPLLIAAIVILILLSVIDVSEKEEEQEKKIQRVAKILHKPKQQTKKKNDAAKLVKNESKDLKPDSSKTKKKTQDPPKKVVTQKRKVVKKVKTISKGKKQQSKVKKSKGPVKSFKVPDFSNAMNKLMAKSDSASKVKVRSKTSNVKIDSDDSLVGSSNLEKIKRASVNSKVGSFEGAASGNIESSMSAKGLADKGSTVVADLPDKTVILGSIDPAIILQILRDHLPVFSHCYQTALERSRARFEGAVTLEFTIGATGRVIKSDIQHKEASRAFKGCINRVLKGMKFPKPKGGGRVDVKQTLNFNLVN